MPENQTPTIDKPMQEQQTKPLLTSKTIVVNAVVALAAMYPPAQEFVANHAPLVLSAIGILNVVLRLVTKSKIVLFAD